MNKMELLDLLKSSGVIMEGHFLLTSGRHSGRFLQCSKLLQYPERAAAVCKMMVRPFIDKGIETVIGPAMGGVILSYETARALGARAVFAEKEGERMVLRRGFSLETGEKVLVVEDAVSTGGSVQKVIDLLKVVNADIVGVALIVDRTAGRFDPGVPVNALLEMDVESYAPAECPLCRTGIPLQKPKDGAL
ncbi:MAG TPA: orotate phosphoribosyltransferase [Firmicutes bacterium]|nr:orotate phosphoribosyltransferase [Bacillota bacterium]